MRGQRFRKKVFYAATALFLLACALPSFLTSPTQAPQALAPEQLGMAIEQTADAAKTQTVTYLPPTLTPTYKSDSPPARRLHYLQHRHFYTCCQLLLRCRHGPLCRASSFKSRAAMLAPEWYQRKWSQSLYRQG